MSNDAAIRKLCIHCKHFVAPTYTVAECRRPDVLTQSPVNGEEYGPFAMNERSSAGRCGVAGLLWVGK